VSDLANSDRLLALSERPGKQGFSILVMVKAHSEINRLAKSRKNENRNIPKKGVQLEEESSNGRRQEVQRKFSQESFRIQADP